MLQNNYRQEIEEELKKNLSYNIIACEEKFDEVKSYGTISPSTLNTENIKPVLHNQENEELFKFEKIKKKLFDNANKIQSWKMDENRTVDPPSSPQELIYQVINEFKEEIYKHSNFRKYYYSINTKTLEEIEEKVNKSL